MPLVSLVNVVVRNQPLLLLYEPKENEHYYIGDNPGEFTLELPKDEMKDKIVRGPSVVIENSF